MIRRMTTNNNRDLLILLLAIMDVLYLLHTLYYKLLIITMNDG